MNFSFEIVALGTALLAACAHPPNISQKQISPSPVQEAVSAAKILPSDSLEEKIEKTLTLINRQRYFDPKGPPPKLEPVFNERYHLDSLRTPEQILTQKVGGFCGSAALVFAAMLKQSGERNENMRIVFAVNAPDLKAICPKSGRGRVEHPQTGASGHVFVAVKFPNGEWRLINTVDGPQYENVVWMTPETLAEQMKNAPVQIPFSMYKNHPPELRSLPMVVFRSWLPDEVPLHTFDQRLDLIASGSIRDPQDADSVKTDRTCRYGADEVKKLKRR